jgi:hypothetical protein
LHVLSATGAEMSGWPYPFRSEASLEHEPQPGRGAGSPLAADLDGDGQSEIFLQLPGGALLVWDARGHRRRDLEAALPARAESTPLLADLDPTAVGLELASLGHFDAARGHRAGSDSLITAPHTELAIWSWSRAAGLEWGELGGAGTHSFHSTSERHVRTAPNDAGLSSFVVGPNPATDRVQARVQLTAPARVRCRLFNLEGEKVLEASSDGVAGTIVELTFDVGRLASGVYLVQMELSTGGRRTRPVAVTR